MLKVKIGHSKKSSLFNVDCIEGEEKLNVPWYGIFFFYDNMELILKSRKLASWDHSLSGLKLKGN